MNWRPLLRRRPHRLGRQPSNPGTGSPGASVLKANRKQHGFFFRARQDWSERGNDETPPTGWVVLAEKTGSQPRRRAADIPARVRLMQHPTGGWTIVSGWLVSMSTTEVIAAHRDFTGLYSAVRQNLETDGADTGGQWSASEEMLRTFLIGHYDPDDPAEAAERMLVALGGKPRFLPAALSND